MLSIYVTSDHNKNYEINSSREINTAHNKNDIAAAKHASRKDYIRHSWRASCTFFIAWPCSVLKLLIQIRQDDVNSLIHNVLWRRHKRVATQIQTWWKSSVSEKLVYVRTSIWFLNACYFRINKSQENEMLTMIWNKQASFVNTVFRGIIRSYKFCSEQVKLNDNLLSSGLHFRLKQM